MTTASTDAALAILRSHGERVTAARRAVIEALEPHDHLTADEIAARAEAAAQGVHRTTIYRALATLGEIGLIAHTHVAGSATIYHLTADSDTGDHHELDHAHVQCSVCGSLFNVEDQLLAPLADDLDREMGFRLDVHHAALLGVCAECRKSATAD
ncbi:Fur family transcriptional regulator [Aeromicrobium sp.]|uniref:Fur family transcriptional regulator n=1 Tax=Aeromicrobium sp. TaxID=1871063 RepID=UPI003C36BFFA